MISATNHNYKKIYGGKRQAQLVVYKNVLEAEAQGIVGLELCERVRRSRVRL
jgi:hypothetical protein